MSPNENEEWRRFPNEELHSLYRSPNIVRVIKSRRLRRVGYVARMEERRNAFQILTSTPAGKRPLGRPRRKREDNTIIPILSQFNPIPRNDTGFFKIHSNIVPPIYALALLKVSFQQVYLLKF